MHKYTASTISLGDRSCKVLYYPPDTEMTCSDSSKHTLLDLLCKFNRIADSDVPLVKKKLDVELDCLVGRRDFRNHSDFYDTPLDAVHTALTKLASVGREVASFPYPNGTRSALSYEYVIYGSDKKTLRGFIIYTSPRASFVKAEAEGVWVILL